MFAFAVRRLGDRNVAEDAVQEALLAGLRGYAQYRGEAQERTWLIGILHRKVVDQIRKMAADRQNTETLEETANPEFEDGYWKRRPATWGALPGIEMERAELQQALARAIDELPHQMRTAFCLREIDQLSSEDICKIMSITPTNLWTLIHRAKLRLRERLDRDWFGKADKD